MPLLGSGAAVIFALLDLLRFLHQPVVNLGFQGVCDFCRLRDNLFFLLRQVIVQVLARARGSLYRDNRAGLGDKLIEGIAFTIVLLLHHHH